MRSNNEMTKMTRRTSYFCLAALMMTTATAFVSCEDEDNEELQGNWVELKDVFPGVERGSAVCFVINNEAYVGTGANTTRTEERERFCDFYKASYSGTYNKGGLVWSSNWDKAPVDGNVASLPESAKRNGAVAFALNGKGYVGTGYNGTTYLKDFWEYDPEANTWTQIADYPGDSVRYAIAFVLPTKETDGYKPTAYVGSGENFDADKKNDFYAFDGTNWTNTNVANLGYKRSQASVFVLTDPKNGQEYAYVVGGNHNGAVDWFERYDYKKNTWEDLYRISNRTKYDFDDDYTLAAYGSTAFVLDDVNGEPRAYLTTGGAGYAGNATWEYNPRYDYWIQKTGFEGSVRKFAVSFVLDLDDVMTDEEKANPNYPHQRAFVTTGCSADITTTGSGGTFYDDVWFFNPHEQYEDKD